MWRLRRLSFQPRSFKWNSYRNLSSIATLPEDSSKSQKAVLNEALKMNRTSPNFIDSVPRAIWAKNKVTPQSMKKGVNKDLEEEALDDIFYEGPSIAQRMTDAEVDEWLLDFEIPHSAFKDCKTEEDIATVRSLYARQLKLECSVRELAMSKYESVHSSVLHDLNKGSALKSSRELLNQWYEPLTEAIQNLQNDIAANKKYEKVSGEELTMDQFMMEDRSGYGPALMVLKPKYIAVLAVNHLLDMTLNDKETCSVTKACLAIGKALQEQLEFLKEEHLKKRGAQNDIERHAALEQLKVTIVGGIKHKDTLKKVEELFDHAGDWDKRIIIKVGSAILNLLVDSCMFQGKGADAVPKPAFSHGYTAGKGGKRTGIINCCDELYNYVTKADENGNRSFTLPYTARYLPMLVPPAPWTSVSRGGYLKLKVDIIRHRDSYWQVKCAKRGDLGQLYDSINSISHLPWRINQDVYAVMKKLWAAGGGVAGLPSRTDYEYPIPENFNMEDEEELMSYKRLSGKIKKRNQNLHSLRCDMLYKLQVAEEFLDEDAIYFPYNMDFRGRVYPIPPNLNHLGDDVCRSLLVFKEKKALGPNGLRWLKIHLANLFGVDKCTLDEREEFTNNHLDKAISSALNPFAEDAWWLEAENPFLALGVCVDLQRALASPDPEKYESRIPIHQDGSCNGLQHYAALGKDRTGAYQVNLCQTDKPQDVYSGVAEKVINQIEHDAQLPEIEIKVAKPEPPSPELKKKWQSDRNNLELKEAYEKSEEEYSDNLRKYKSYLKEIRSRKYSRFLRGQITRKVVKQTVMTSVYGVTFIGARKQIQARLEDSMLPSIENVNRESESDIYHASCYAAEVTMDSMGNLFGEARGIMKWLADCAQIVSASGQPMSWITPLGLPVVQPYRRNGTLQIKTKMQSILVSLEDCLPVSQVRQKSAFPPNFVHSLDSTHMLLTSRKCDDLGLSFAAVHDSYWTHPCSVDIMNSTLREEFVGLYNRPLLEELRQQLVSRFPDEKFPEIPKLGDFDVREVLDSTYFFN